MICNLFLFWEATDIFKKKYQYKEGEEFWVVELQHNLKSLVLVFGSLKDNLWNKNRECELARGRSVGMLNKLSVFWIFFLSISRSLSIYLFIPELSIYLYFYPYLYLSLSLSVSLSVSLSLTFPIYFSKWDALQLTVANFLLGFHANFARLN